ncbi:lipopolysaccharide biosynthesis protein [Photobacterium leiognathi]|uniref:lipopolysaccharide biosynthesis protein n=1 Tax=Photobacterium leiognathi TaxID=553611 RepID=UPI002982A238|nr:hypothetical protein [Photobacterium leiognathi]
MFISLMIRGLSVLSSFASTSLIISELGLHASGEYFSSVAISLVLSTVYSFGINNSIIKYSKKIKGNNLNIIIFFIRNLLLTTFPFVILSVVILLFVSSYNWLIILMGVSYALSQMLQIYLVSISLVNKAYLLFNIIPQLIIVSLVYINKTDIILYYILSYIISFFIMFIVLCLNNNLKENDIEDYYKKNTLPFKERFDFFQQDLLGQMFTSISTIVISTFLSSSDVAIYNIYQKLASVCNVIISVLNQIYLSKVISYLMEDCMFKIFKIRQRIFVTSSLIIGFYIIVVSVFWPIILKLFHVPDLSRYLFFIICAGYFFVAKANMLSYILNSIGYSSNLRNYSYLTCFLGVFLSSLLSVIWGVDGAIYALFFMLINQSILLIFKFKKSRIAQVHNTSAGTND